MSEKTIEINDTEIGLRKLPTILSTAIVTSRFYCPPSCMDKYSGALGIKMGDFMYIIPKMMETSDKQRFILQVKNISSKKCSLNKKKMLLKEITKGSHAYAVNDEQEEVAIKIYEHMSEEEKNEKNGIFLKNYLLENEKYILNAIFAHENVELLKIYLNSVISTHEDLQFVVNFLDKQSDSVKNYLEMRAYVLQLLNAKPKSIKDDFDL
ncbi:hypothetical protein G7B22_26240 [Blautia sp. MSK.20.9]|uniref:hypothetical protein n=1 Tax=Blautia sp. MSK20_18 TaxID=2883186 RepID=UPI00156E8BAC|nr:hypothetical protein [Blautia sp. MSK20_18]MCB7509184.1 hypothetical protein [Blautia sp. MSK20_18]NSK11885.1 hypothetical protein [Blautia sp. MSK.20.9]